MKKSIFLWIPLLLAACANDEKSPDIIVEALYITPNGAAENAVSKNFAEHMDELPSLQVGDEVEAFLALDGNGAELKTFTLHNDDNVKAELHYKEAEVTTESNLTDEEKGQLRFKDGVVHTNLSVEATVEKVEPNGDVYLTFYLSSKAECEAAQEVIVLRTTDKPADAETDAE